MGTKRRTTGRLAALGGLALTVAIGCGVPGHAPSRPAPEDGDGVAVGYGTRSRDDVTGSISSVTSERVGRGSSTRIEDLLETIPGLQVLPLGGGDFTVRIRGAGAGIGDAEPLLVIDDAPVLTGRVGSALVTVPPQHIVRIDVLKDAASTAVYGPRGANGVIIVTTIRRR